MGLVLVLDCGDWAFLNKTSCHFDKAVKRYFAGCRCCSI